MKQYEVDLVKALTVNHKNLYKLLEKNYYQDVN